MFTRCIAAAGVVANMLQATPCKHPSEPESRVEMKTKQSIDFYDMKTAFMLKRVLDQLCNEDDVRFTVYGSNLYHFELKIDHDEWDLMNRVSKGLCKICTRVAPTPFKSDIMKPCSMVE